MSPKLASRSSCLNLVSPEITDMCYNTWLRLLLLTTFFRRMFLLVWSVIKALNHMVLKLMNIHLEPELHACWPSTLPLHPQQRLRFVYKLHKQRIFTQYWCIGIVMISQNSEFLQTLYMLLATFELTQFSIDDVK